MYKTLTLLFAALILLTTACKKDDKQPVDPQKEKVKMLIGNWRLMEEYAAGYQDGELIQDVTFTSPYMEHFRWIFQDDGTVEYHFNVNDKYVYYLYRYQISGDNLILSDRQYYGNDKMLTDKDPEILKYNIVEFLPERLVIYRDTQYTRSYGVVKNISKLTFKKFN